MVFYPFPQTPYLHKTPYNNNNNNDNNNNNNSNDNNNNNNNNNDINIISGVAKT